MVQYIKVEFKLKWPIYKSSIYDLKINKFQTKA